MYMVKIKNSYYKMINTYSLENSSNEVKYSDVVIDFNEGTFLDLPLQYQEIQILSGQEEDIKNGNGVIRYFGYVESYNLSTIKTLNDPKELTLTILSPMKLSTLRTVNINGYYDIDTLLDLVLEPLIEEGFTIKEKNIKNRAFTVQFITQTVEYCMNYISNSKSIFWYINELKEIYIYDISYLTSSEPKLEIFEDEIPKGFIDIKPTLVSVDYANVLNLKRGRTFFYSCNGSFVDRTKITNFVLTASPKVIENGGSLSLNYPVVIDEETLKKISDEENLYSDISTEVSSESSRNKYGIFIEISLMNIYGTDGTSLQEEEVVRRAYIYWDSEQEKIIKSDNIAFSDEGDENKDETKEFILQRDNFFSNLIIGIKWNNKLNEGNGIITTIYSHSALKYTTAKIYFNEEIEKCKGIINSTGKVEKTINLNEKWLTQKELIEYAKSLIVQNANTCNEVQLTMDIQQNIKLGSLVRINMPNFFVDGNFIVTSIKENYIEPDSNQYIYKLRNINLLENFIDFFRTSDIQESTSEVNDVIIGAYTEDIINQKHEMEVVEE